MLALTRSNLLGAFRPRGLPSRFVPLRPRSDTPCGGCSRARAWRGDDGTPLCFQVSDARDVGPPSSSLPDLFREPRAQETQDKAALWMPATSAGKTGGNARARSDQLETLSFPLIPANAGTQIGGLVGGLVEPCKPPSRSAYDLGPGIRRDERKRRGRDRPDPVLL